MLIDLGNDNDIFGEASESIATFVDQLLENSWRRPYTSYRKISSVNRHAIHGNDQPMRSSDGGETTEDVYLHELPEEHASGSPASHQPNQMELALFHDPSVPQKKPGRPRAVVDVPLRMGAPSDARWSTTSRTKGGNPNDLRDCSSQLDLEGEEYDDMMIDEEDPRINKSVEWLALARVHSEENFSHEAFFKDMRAAWNSAQQVRFRRVGENLFVVQAFYLGVLERTMERGPCLSRNMAVLLIPYDGLSKVEDQTIAHMAIWPQIHKLSDAYCNKEIVEKLIKNVGKVRELKG
ncbi:hypothetical protein D1007_18239 [Hordeum vulgare]|nr:hypothetical protein D1007_18239 [Hordeum vulgare]